MSSNLENTPYHSILQQETYRKLLGQFISLGETLTDANDHKGLNSDTVTRILSVKFRMQQPDLHTGWRAATRSKDMLNRPSAKQRNKRQILFGWYKNLSHV